MTPLTDTPNVDAAGHAWSSDGRRTAATGPVREPSV
jgi:hypothetical protein